MNWPRGWHFKAVLCIGGILAATIGPDSVRAEEPLPSATNLTQRLIERARDVAENGRHPHYTFLSRSRLEELDAKGKVLEAVEKLYRVDWIAGLPVKTLIEIKGRDLSPEELKAEQQGDEKFQERFTATSPRKLAARRQSVVTEQLLDRFRFDVRERILWEGRPTLVVTFAAKESPDSGSTIQDRILNRLAGTIWIDEEEADTARVRITLVEPLTLGWLGILGSLTRCDFDLHRRRMPEGLWINQRHSLHIHCRKLANTMRFRKTELASEFQIVEDGHPLLTAQSDGEADQDEPQNHHGQPHQPRTATGHPAEGIPQ